MLRMVLTAAAALFLVFTLSTEIPDPDGPRPYDDRGVILDPDG